MAPAPFPSPGGGGFAVQPEETMESRYYQMGDLADRALRRVWANIELSDTGPQTDSRVLQPLFWRLEEALSSNVGEDE